MVSHFQVLKSSRENLVVTAPYESTRERASERPHTSFVHTLGKGDESTQGNSGAGVAECSPPLLLGGHRNVIFWREVAST